MAQNPIPVPKKAIPVPKKSFSPSWQGRAKGVISTWKMARSAKKGRKPTTKKRDLGGFSASEVSSMGGSASAFGGGARQGAKMAVQTYKSKQKPKKFLGLFRKRAAADKSSMSVGPRKSQDKLVDPKKLARAMRSRG